MHPPIIQDEPRSPQSAPAPTAASTSASPRGAAPPSWFRWVLGNLMRLGSLKFHQVFWILAAATLVFLLIQLANSRGSASNTRITTPAAQDFKDLQMAQSIQIVLGKPLKNAAGELVTVSDPQVRLQAGVRVKRWQDEELIAKQSNITILAMLKGMTSPKHPCYQKSRPDCLQIVRRFNDQDRVKAAAAEDLKGLMKASQVEESLDLIAQGDPPPTKFDDDLYTLAVATVRTARNELQQRSSGGQAKALIDSVVNGGDDNDPRNATNAPRRQR
ncbi:hypothetical protein NIES2135_61600 (plasmid) [Leptolyngbya boryana NIES-2135]|jgi:hypothetical protein|uniref:Uncharacterized protein n=1 Tax=Leptolyngbya boryana NIES-2135 TaxID=1973484 RepID=A0A1Z4JRJ1_LEPBY|nr:MULTISPECIES: hypothetical protein [Leptolyngbya]BAY59283.1 hypothetical protein NIES2135_61600 [Leptolyngbya boryana NIES-2135]MBD2372871.1 hypothetical protein [Leptolyngbya sp. FACHB-238]MBD2397376.1 hypothetical protein [Leptolyngbya sp. FACHB-239]MBD2403819.1 hypothetical protein [Leptolyngbya sp. FACHB-402]ULP33475.1 hypothetical protein MCP04_30565 [Leptolyngbya boryana IU 594]